MKLYSNFNLVLAITLLALTSSCLEKNDKNTCPNQVEAKIIDMSSLDGCGWMIQLNDGSKLNPINLDDFSISLLDGNNIKLSYTENTEMMDICMSGKIISIICISDRD